MRNYTSVKDLNDLKQAVQEAIELKKDPFAFNHLGKNKTILLIFFNSSLRTRLSTQKAAMNLGMNTIVLDINQGAWKLETEMGVVMDGDKPEHIKEAIPVMSNYCDIIGVRAFASLEDKAKDYSEVIINQFIELSGKPVISLESATCHPLQALADIITIEEHKKTDKPKVVLTWAPHPRSLPQAVPNSFAEFAIEAGYDVVITHPEGYELCEDYTKGARIEYNQDLALKDADFVYAKNWSPYADENYGKVINKDMDWTVNEKKMALTNNGYFMHCLPVRRNMIVSDGVIDGANSIVVKEAANREFSAELVIKRILETLA